MLFSIFSIYFADFLQTISFDDCIKAQTEGKTYIEVDSTPQRLEQLIPDALGFKKIPQGALTIGTQLGEVLNA